MDFFLFKCITIQKKTRYVFIFLDPSSLEIIIHSIQFIVAIFFNWKYSHKKHTHTHTEFSLTMFLKHLCFSHWHGYISDNNDKITIMITTMTTTNTHYLFIYIYGINMMTGKTYVYVCCDQTNVFFSFFNCYFGFNNAICLSSYSKIQMYDDDDDDWSW